MQHCKIKQKKNKVSQRSQHRTKYFNQLITLLENFIRFNFSPIHVFCRLLVYYANNLETIKTKAIAKMMTSVKNYTIAVTWTDWLVLLVDDQILL